MKKIKLVVLSLLALAFARPSGFCTANTVAENEADIAALKATLASQAEEIAQLRAGIPSVIPPSEMLGSTALLIKGAGVHADDVTWRIRAGLSPAQAVEVAVLEKIEAESKEAKK